MLYLEDFCVPFKLIELGEILPQRVISGKGHFWPAVHSLGTTLTSKVNMLDHSRIGKEKKKKKNMNHYYFTVLFLKDPFQMFTLLYRLHLPQGSHQPVRV